MTISEAYDLVNAPFVIENAYREAEETILAQCATPNQRALYGNLPLCHKRNFLQAIVKRVLFTVPA